jgi:hypothetical protein
MSFKNTLLIARHEIFLAANQVKNLAMHKIGKNFARSHGTNFSFEHQTKFCKLIIINKLAYFLQRKIFPLNIKKSYRLNKQKLHQNKSIYSSSQKEHFLVGKKARWRSLQNQKEDETTQRNTKHNQEDLKN